MAAKKNPKSPPPFKRDDSNMAKKDSKKQSGKMHDCGCGGKKRGR